VLACRDVHPVSEGDDLMEDREAIAAAAAIVHIQQLAINYAVGVDQRDIDLVAEQFVPDVACGHWGTGRDALKRMYREGDATMDLSIHRVSNHKVDLVDDDHATGIVYLVADHRQHDGTWAYLAGAYHDRYERIDGRWLIRDRKLLFWFRDRDALPPSTRRETDYRVFDKWSNLPDAWPSWGRFWDEVGDEGRTQHPSVRRDARSSSQ
jgi:SnoaL-like domain